MLSAPISFMLETGSTDELSIPEKGTSPAIKICWMTKVPTQPWPALLDSIPAPFQRLQQASLQCLQSTSSNLQPAKKEEPGTTKSPVQIVGMEKQLKQQLTDMKTNLSTRNRGKEDLDSSLNVCLEIVHTPLENAVCAVKNKELCIYRMQCAHALRADIQSNTQESRSSLELMNNSMQICNRIHSVQMNNRILEEKISEVRRSRIGLKIKQHELFKDVKKLEEDKRALGELEMKIQVRRKENIEGRLNRVVLIQEVFLEQ